MGYFFIMLLISCGIGLIVGLANSNNGAIVRLKIASFGYDIFVSSLELLSNDFKIEVNFGNGEKENFYGKTIGEVQFNISKTCKRRAQKRDGNNFKEYKTGYIFPEVSVVKDGETLSNSQYYNLTTREMRSSKNPIVGYHHEDGFKPMWGPSDHPLRAKL